MMDEPMVESVMPKPHMDFDSESLPAMKNWQVGKDYVLTVKVHMKSKSQGGYKKPDDFFSGCFEIVDAKPVTK